MAGERWQCFPRAFADITGLRLEFILDIVGHDGSEIWYPDLPEPYCRRGFHPQEILQPLANRGWYFAEFHKMCYMRGRGADTPVTTFPSRHFNEVINGATGVGVGHADGILGHAVAYLNGEPLGPKLKLESFFKFVDD